MALSTDQCSDLWRRLRRNIVEMGIESRTNEPRFNRSKLEDFKREFLVSARSVGQRYQKACLEPTSHCSRPCRDCYCAEHIEHGLHMHCVDNRGLIMLIKFAHSRVPPVPRFWRSVRACPSLKHMRHCLWNDAGSDSCSLSDHVCRQVSTRQT
jgi:hypothetical protein